MILEHALLTVRPGEEAAFEAAFAVAAPIISSMEGFSSLRLERSLEAPLRYLLLVEWRSLADHVEGFRRHPDYARWRALLHHFYEPFPEVLHFETVATSGG